MKKIWILCSFVLLLAVGMVAAAEESSNMGFVDIAGHWGEAYINEAAENGLFHGNVDGTFRPDESVTRAQFVTVLWRMAGSPTVENRAPFADIAGHPADFQTAIAWAYAEGYINGVSATEFDPNGTLTREAGMKILHFYSGGKSGNEMLFSAVYDGSFEDSREISGWAKASVYWGIYHKLISGTSETTLHPQAVATRAQLAKILMTYIRDFGKN